MICRVHTKVSVSNIDVIMVTPLGDYSRTTLMGIASGHLISLNLIISYPINHYFFAGILVVGGNCEADGPCCSFLMDGLVGCWHSCCLGGSFFYVGLGGLSRLPPNKVVCSYICGGLVSGCCCYSCQSPSIFPWVVGALPSPTSLSYYFFSSSPYYFDGDGCDF